MPQFLSECYSVQILQIYLTGSSDRVNLFYISPCYNRPVPKCQRVLVHAREWSRLTCQCSVMHGKESIEKTNLGNIFKTFLQSCFNQYIKTDRLFWFIVLLIDKSTEF